MKKIFFLSILSAFFLIFFVGKLSAQVNIGADVAPHTFSALEVQGQYKTGVYGGLRLPQLTTTQRDAITGLSAPEAKGLTIFNTTTNCMEFWNGTEWKSWCDSGTGGGTDPGTPDDPGTYGGVECGAYIAPGVWKKFMCRNLGVNPYVNPFIPSALLNGDYYQWGAPMPAGTRDAIIGTWSSAVPAGWYGDNSTATDAKVKSIYDPCPAGYRIPTYTEWEGVFNTTLNPRTNIPSGTWSSGTDSWSGAMFGDNLFLPAAGYRYNSDGALHDRGSFGVYWSSRMNTASYAYVAYFVSGYAYMYSNFRSIGQSIRCIAE